MFPINSNSSVKTNEGDCVEINLVLRNRRELTTYLPIKLGFAALYIGIFTVSVFGNICVLVAIIRGKQLKSVRNLFIFSLCFSDLIVSLFSNFITPVAAFSKVWHFGRLLCYFVPLAQGMSVCISTFTLAAIAIDRFILIIFPTNCPINRRQAVVISVFIWLMAAALTAPMMLHQRMKRHAPLCGQFCVEYWPEEEQLARRIYGSVLMVLTYALPIVIITGCYVCICIRLTKRPKLSHTLVYRSTLELHDIDNGQGQGRLRHNNSGASINTQKSSNHQKRHISVRRRNRTNRMLICMVVAFACCMLPIVSFNLLRDYNALPTTVTDQVYLFGVLVHCIAMTTTIWNPLLYAWFNPQLRRAFRELMPTSQNRHISTDGGAGSTCGRSIQPPYGSVFIPDNKIKYRYDIGVSNRQEQINLPTTALLRRAK